MNVLKYLLIRLSRIFKPNWLKALLSLNLGLSFGLTLMATGAMAAEPTLLEQLKISQGHGQFIQKKYFKFLSKPIKSTGVFVVKQQTALWHTQTPVFSQVLLSDDAIYRRISADDSYQVMLKDSEFGRVLAAIFSADISAQDWLINQTESDNCLELSPKSQQLQQAFSTINLCLLADNKRLITLLNPQDNKTEIEMTLLATELSDLATASLDATTKLDMTTKP